MSPYRNKKQKSTVSLWVTGIVFIVVYVSVSGVRNFRSATPAVYGDSVSLMAHSKSSLVKKVLELQSKIDANSASLVALSTLEQENIALKAELYRNDYIDGTLARVIIPPNRSLYDTLIIDVGSEEGIVVGQTVYAFGSIALGTISEILPHSSTVLFFSASGRETVGTTTGSDLAVTLIGRGGGEYEVRMPRDISFQIGGVISEQSLSVHPLATIQKIITDPRDPFQRLLAKVPVNLQTMKWVVVK